MFTLQKDLWEIHYFSTLWNFEVEAPIWKETSYLHFIYKVISS